MKTWLGPVAGLAIVAASIILFQVGYGPIPLLVAIPLVPCALVYLWKKNHGLKPGWEFIALSGMSVVVGIYFGLIYVLVSILVYFLWIRYQTNKKNAAANYY